MFKVSLLPASYKKYMQGKSLKDMFSKVALLVMVCLLIIYGGIEIKYMLVKRQLNEIKQANSQLAQQFPALEQYQAIYNNLKANETIYNGIKPKSISATEFVTKVNNSMPSYVHITEISLADWFTAGICNVKCVSSSFEDVVDCKEMFAKQDYISSAVTTEIVKTYNTDNTVAVTFTLSLAANGTLSSDGKASVVVQTTAAAAAATTTAASGSGATTASSGTTTTSKNSDETTTTKSSKSAKTTTTTEE